MSARRLLATYVQSHTGIDKRPFTDRFTLICVKLAVGGLPPLFHFASSAFSLSLSSSPTVMTQFAVGSPSHSASRIPRRVVVVVVVVVARAADSPLKGAATDDEQRARGSFFSYEDWSHVAYVYFPQLTLRGSATATRPSLTTAVFTTAGVVVFARRGQPHPFSPHVASFSPCAVFVRCLCALHTRIFIEVISPLRDAR